MNPYDRNCWACSLPESGPLNSICSSCYAGAKGMIAFLDQADDRAAGPHASKSTNTNAKGISRGLNKMREMEEREKNLEVKLSFLDAVSALKGGILTDILVKPGKGPPIPAHRAVLAAKSEILRTMLISDDCKAAAEDSISLPEFSYDELMCLLEFLYSGSLPTPPNNDSSSSSLYYSMLIASDKYNIPYLRLHCRSRILAALDTSNALDVLQLSHAFSDAVLKEQATNLIVNKAKDVVFSDGYKEFARRNVHLAVHISQALAMRNK